ncbi:FCD domain-containing protein [Paenibacillus sp. TRM 82003]|uniref:FadR/GntR family transcriptional regulator n=1 Tax=Kineococcus sp. TRM81007 TaxID=2925831 RepID=UPI001F56F501|nr:FCD domain-containing protein [Kineococcus sp. TRM81007]MCI2239108.1 FCD domain-containing protein [Kineococcus sp. TRM81007]MCI3924527.1 FCD domain-containing protein [Paenibacillus sp. TRM 82003]
MSPAPTEAVRGLEAALGPVPPGSAAAEVAGALLDLLTGGAMRPGDRLPGERILADRLGVGRSAVREGLAALQVLGVVEIRVGSGSYLRSTTSELLPRSLTWGLLVGAESTEHLLEVRSGLERQAAVQAAASPREVDLLELDAHLDEQRRSRDDVEAFVTADMRFHRTVARMAGNPVLEDLLSTSRALLRVWAERYVKRATDFEATVAEHAAVAAAIRAGDQARAGEAMETHMRTASARLRTDPGGAAGAEAPDPGPPDAGSAGS